jgi:hypothetical protein
LVSDGIFAWKIFPGFAATRNQPIMQSSEFPKRVELPDAKVARLSNGEDGLVLDIQKWDERIVRIQVENPMWVIDCVQADITAFEVLSPSDSRVPEILKTFSAYFSTWEPPPKWIAILWSLEGFGVAIGCFENSKIHITE